MFNTLFNFLEFNRKPKLLILGAQKAGTTTLFDMLDSIPGFCGGNGKEVNFFTKDVNYQKGAEWYFGQFGDCDRKAIKFEATPEYLYYPDVPQKIASFNKATKFIVLLREPSARCYSAWNMFRSFNADTKLANHIYETFTQYANPPVRNEVKDLLFTENFPTFEQAVLDDIKRCHTKSDVLEPSFVRRGLYSEQIENYLQYFSLSSFLFIEQSELNQPNLALKKISTFLDVEINVTLIKAPVVSNIGMYEKNGLGVDEIMPTLKAFYKPYNEKLFNQIGIHYNWNEQ